ncbi:hypothetical protein Tco_1010023, partial [Tanacetum coccineum]
DIVKIVLTAVHSGTDGESAIACTVGIMTVVGWYGPSKMHFLKASPFGLVAIYLKKLCLPLSIYSRCKHWWMIP